jgi:hypothetical protein
MLRDELQTWVFEEEASYILGCDIGVFDGTPNLYRLTLNMPTPISTALYKMLNELVTAGVLERRDDPEIEFRWVQGAPVDPPYIE